jgi:hypothetical protein
VKRVAASIVIIFFSSNCHAQLKNYSFELSVNYPWIAELSKNPQLNLAIPMAPGSQVIYTNVGILKEKYKGMPGLGMSTVFQIYENKFLFVELGLGAQLYRYQRAIIVETSNPAITLPKVNLAGQPYGIIFASLSPRGDSSNLVPIGTTNFETLGKIGRTNTFYLQLPIWVGKNFYNNKLSVKVGGSAQLLVMSSQIKERFTQSGITEYKDKSTNEFTNVILNGLAQFAYKPTKHIGIDFTYQRSINPIYSESFVGKSYYNILSLSVSYHIQRQ